MTKQEEREVFVNATKECVGKTASELEQMIIEEHEKLAEIRTRIQARLAFRRAAFEKP